MKLLTFCSFKGGAGKTTALMGLCSALVSAGKSVALFEADENRPLTKWMQNAERESTWDPGCEVFIADELPLLEQAYQDADSKEFDFALADTHGGSSELNNTIIASSNLLMIPTMLTPLDVDEALVTYRYVMELLIGEKITVPTAILRQRVPVGRMTSSQRSVSEMLNVLPQFGAPMYERDAFAAMKDRGMLHRTLERMAEDPSTRLMRRNLQVAMDEVVLLKGLVHDMLEA